VAKTRRPSFKGCCAMCAWGKGRVRGLGDGTRMPVRDLRTLGTWHRVNRHDIPADQET
jgi:hypothetical protein